MIIRGKPGLAFSCILGGLLLGLGWPEFGFTPLLFVGFVPFLYAEDQYKKENLSGANLFGSVYLGFLVWNVTATWWVYNSTAAGGIMAFVFNALFMSLVFQAFHFTKRMLGDGPGYLSLIFYWLAFEYLHLQWDISWPWLTLGNGFASSYKWIQWYEYTGVFGGGLWILSVNILLYSLLKRIWTKQVKLSADRFNRRAICLGALIFLPISVSYFLYYHYTEKKDPVKIAVIQPNVDPYNEKFNALPQSEQLARILQLASTVVDSTFSYVVSPETSLPEDMHEAEIENYSEVATLHAFIKPYPKLNFIIGLTSDRLYKPGEKISATARKYMDAEKYYDIFNAAMQINNYSPITFYHKSKLVPGVEKMPFPALLKPLEKFAIDLGGTTGSYGVQEKRTPFVSKQGSVAPSICYESIYGEFMSKYALNGADLIFILTNDGWWGDTPGYKQHMGYARLRAIENRRSIARSANTGISCFINQRGDVSQPTKWWEQAVITAELNRNKELTFYTKHGDYIAVIASILAVITFLFSLYKRFFVKLKA